MKPFVLDRSHIILAVIAILCIGALLAMYAAFRADEVNRSIRTESVMGILFVMEDEGRPVATEYFMFHPASGRGAMLDIPAETGLIIPSVKRVDRIESIYDPKHPALYAKETGTLIGPPPDFWIVVDRETFIRSVDLMDGMELFLPTPIALSEPERVRIPGGALVLDGAKSAQYLFIDNPQETETDAVARRQYIFQSYLRRIAQKHENLRHRRTFSLLREGLRTNLSKDALLRFLAELGKVDADRIVLQRTTGIYRTVDGKRLLFPHYDGELVRDIVKQTANALMHVPPASSGRKTYSIEILNGTAARGLAKTTADIYQSFGYEIASFGNADRNDYQRTVIIDRFGDAAVAGLVGSVIRCMNFTDQEQGAGGSSDFTIILGTDFNGRFCVR